MKKTSPIRIEKFLKITKRIKYLNSFLKNNKLKFSFTSDLIINTFKNNKKVLICGNGGSAAESQHFAAELVATLHKNNRKALPVISLTTDTSFITAFSNDFSYENIFKRQIEAIGSEGDVLIVLSTSGTSKNILNALKKAKSKGIKNIAIFGKKIKDPNNLINIQINTNSKDNQISQELHLCLLHILADSIDNYFQ